MPCDVEMVFNAVSYHVMLCYAMLGILCCVMLCNIITVVLSCFSSLEKNSRIRSKAASELASCCELRPTRSVSVQREEA